MTTTIRTVDGSAFTVTGDPEQVANRITDSRTRKRGEFLAFTSPSGIRVWLANDRIVSVIG